MKITRRQLNRIIRESLDSDMKKIYILVGPPSVGKSTWIRQNVSDAYVISSDEVAEKVASKHGMTYDDMFDYPIQPGKPDYTEDQHHKKWGPMIDQGISWKTWMPKAWQKVNAAEIEAASALDAAYAAAVPSGKDIVIDMTNMNTGSRDFAIKRLGNTSDYEKIAVNFDWNGDVDFLKKVAAKRSKERFEKTGMKKTIPPAAFDRMIGGYQAPTEEEGYKVQQVPAWWAKK